MKSRQRLLDRKKVFCQDACLLAWQQPARSYTHAAHSFRPSNVAALAVANEVGQFWCTAARSRKDTWLACPQQRLRRLRLRKCTHVTCQHAVPVHQAAGPKKCFSKSAISALLFLVMTSKRYAATPLRWFLNTNEGLAPETGQSRRGARRGCSRGTTRPPFGRRGGQG